MKSIFDVGFVVLSNVPCVEGKVLEVRTSTSRLTVVEFYSFFIESVQVWVKYSHLIIK